MAPFPSLRKFKSKRRLREESAKIDEIVQSERVQQSQPSPTQQLSLDDDDLTAASISPVHQRYITALSDGVQLYSRFFSALLIPQADHESFFSDLRAFRTTPHAVVLLLASPNPGPPLPTGQPTLNPFASPADSRAVTTAFLASPYAHPWCRATAAATAAPSGGGGGGWRKANLGGTAKRTKDDAREEDRLHKLLVPIWCAFRRRMYVSEDELARWEADHAEKVGSGLGSESKSAEVAKEGLDRSVTEFIELGFKKYGSHGQGLKSIEESAFSNQPPRAASGLFVGAAVAGFIMSDKRVSKYVEKQLAK